MSLYVSFFRCSIVMNPIVNIIVILHIDKYIYVSTLSHLKTLLIVFTKLIKLLSFSLKLTINAYVY